MFATALRVVAVTAMLAPGPSRTGTVDHTHVDAVVSDSPVIAIDGGSPAQRQTVIAAVDRYLSVGLLLPDLDVHFHTGMEGCDDKQGLFHREGDLAVIDLCFGGEFLALHELGHAWERFNLHDSDRAAFQRMTGATTWRSIDVAWGRRGAEQAANTMAKGLLSTPLASLEYHAADLARFEALTGITSPRTVEVVPVVSNEPGVDDIQRARLAAYEAWRHASATAN
jgi:hypothetical protein